MLLLLWLPPGTRPDQTKMLRCMATERQALRLQVDAALELILTPHCMDESSVALVGVLRRQ